MRPRVSRPFLCAAPGRLVVMALSATIATGHASPLAAYQTFVIPVGTGSVAVKWSHLPVRYFVTDRGVTGVSSAQFRDAAARAFTTWQNVTSAAVFAEFAGFTSADPGDEDGQNTLGFLDRPDLERVLGSTAPVRRRDGRAARGRYLLQLGHAVVGGPGRGGGEV